LWRPSARGNVSQATKGELDEGEEERMAERQAEQPKQDAGTPSAPGPTRRGVDPLALATFVGVAAVLVTSFASWRDVSRIDQRLRELEERAGQSAGGPAARAERRGPDPDRVYAIRIAGAPSRGNVSAPVTIAEFSDFQ
jgi:hypothetical protein